MSSVPPISPSPPPRTPGAALSPGELQMIRDAIRARRYVRGAARVAFFSAASMIAIGALSLIFSVMPLSLFDAAVSIALLALGYGEFRGSVLMKRADPAAPWFLCRNQLMLIAMVAVVCPIVIYRMIPDIDQAFTSNPELNQLLDQKVVHNGAVHYAPFVVAGLVALVALSQGSLALYYITRKRRIRDYQDATPEWVQQVLATTA
jgi:hypothetical protein